MNLDQASSEWTAWIDLASCRRDRGPKEKRGRTQRDIQRSLRFAYDRVKRTQSNYHGRPNRTPGRAPDYPWSTAPKPAPTRSYRRSVIVDACAREDSPSERAGRTTNTALRSRLCSTEPRFGRCRNRRARSLRFFPIQDSLLFFWVLKETLNYESPLALLRA